VAMNDLAMKLRDFESVELRRGENDQCLIQCLLPGWQSLNSWDAQRNIEQSGKRLE
jgi:hypothetical protein